MEHPFCMHVLCLCMKYMNERRVVHYSSVNGINTKYLKNKLLFYNSGTSVERDFVEVKSNYDYRMMVLSDFFDDSTMVLLK